jgi:RND family efflux transporter MFP subunit
MSFLQKKRLVPLALFAACAVVGIMAHHAHGDDDDKKPGTDKPDSPTATVKTDTLTQGDISQSITAFGSVTAQPGTIAVFSAPYECRVNRILVTAGQPIDKGIDLIDVEPSPGAKLAWQEAQSNLEVAKQDLAQTQQRFDMKLATNSDLLQSQQALKLAQLRLDNLKGQGDHQILHTDSAGLIAKVDAQQGQIVPAGTPLIETIARDQVEVRLGVEPSLISRLAVGQAVKLFPTDDAVPGKIRLITQRVNPDTRLVDVFVTPDSRDGLLLDSFMRAELVTDTKNALIAPRDAVLPDDSGYTLFTVKDGKSVKHTVTIGLHNDTQTAVSAADLHAGDTIVVQGNLELDDKVAVQTEGTK